MSIEPLNWQSILKLYHTSAARCPSSAESFHLAGSQSVSLGGWKGKSSMKWLNKMERSQESVYYTKSTCYYHVWTPSRASAVKSRSRLHSSNSAEVSSRASSLAVSRPINNSDHNNGSWVEYLVVRLLQFTSKFCAKHESQRMRWVVLSSFLAYELCTVSGRHDSNSTPPLKCTVPVRQ